MNTIKIKREEVYKAIDSERSYQDLLWGGALHDGQKSVGDFLVYMDQYLEKAKKDYTTKVGAEAALQQIRKLAGLAVACMEYNGAPKR